MRLFYFALQSEAQIFIERFRAKKISSKPKIFISGEILIVVGGVGKEALNSTLEIVFKNYKIEEAINIGIAGANSRDIAIGRLFCTYPAGEISLISNETPTTSTTLQEPTLFDMEGEFFYHFCKDIKEIKAIWIFKVVSDYLESKILPKDFVKKLIQKRYQQIMESLK